MTVDPEPASDAARIVALHATILQRVARREPLDVVLDALTRQIETLAPGMLASILLLDDDGITLRHGSAPSLPAEYNALIDGLPAGPVAGSCGTAVHRREPVIVVDVMTDPLWADYRDLAAGYELGSCWSTPIVADDDRVLGTFALYYRAPRSPDPMHLELIDAAVHLARTAIEHHHVERQLQEQNELLRHMADHDPLTGLANRRRLEQELDRHVATTQRYGPRGALLLLDLDHFKYINDALGHAGGDTLIISIAHLLRERLRTTDILARIGGDEFAILLPQVDTNEATSVAEDLVAAIAAHTVRIEGHDRTVTTSIGVAPVEPGMGVTGADLLVRADLAMYDAKDAGRNRVVTLSGAQLAAAPTEARVTWIERIRHALATDGFVLHAQPVLPLVGEGRHYELLLRMRSVDGGLVPPGAFLPIAERLDLIHEIDRWVVGEAITLLGRTSEVALEVNLSGRSIGDLELLDFIERRLHEEQVDASRLIFEVTETGAVENFERALMFAQRLGDLGCRFALDDFGAGFGSFYYLKHLPFDFLKIDGEFIRRSRSNRVDQLVIDAVVHIAHALGKATIAECVEDAATAALLREHGVDYLQGYWLGRPEPAEVLLTA